MVSFAMKIMARNPFKMSTLDYKAAPNKVTCNIKL